MSWAKVGVMEAVKSSDSRFILKEKQNLLLDWICNLRRQEEPKDS